MAAWRFLLDENIDPKTANYLEKESVNAEHVRDALWQGAKDEQDVLPYARNEARIIVTSDVKPVLCCSTTILRQPIKPRPVYCQ
ncbi:hypothetical protein BRD06_10095 [Halobacteriales archaeon QS_9_67_15]|nr:MAG: hypothetical protein BRD06_10095 [Halobacteriales archaeon QS_9_67_15]